MQAEKSKESAAKELLREALELLLEPPYRELFQAGVLNVGIDAEGWSFLICHAKGNPSTGAISFNYYPRGTVTKFLEDCEQKFDTITVTCYSFNAEAV